MAAVVSPFEPLLRRALDAADSSPTVDTLCNFDRPWK